MNIVVNWTAVSCIVALLIGLSNIALSWMYESYRRKHEEEQREREELQSKRETRDKALNVALQLHTTAFRRQHAADAKTRLDLQPEVTGLIVLLGSYGFPVKEDLFNDLPYDGKAVSVEFLRLINQIMQSTE